MVMCGAEGGLKLGEVVNGRKSGGRRRAGRTSFSMILSFRSDSFCMRLVNAAGQPAEAVILSGSAAEAREKSYSARRKNS